MPVAWARATAACWGCLLRTMTMQEAPVMSAVRTTWALVRPVRRAKRSWSKARTSLSRSLAATDSTWRCSWSPQQMVSPERISTTSPTVIMGCRLPFLVEPAGRGASRNPEAKGQGREAGGGAGGRDGMDARPEHPADSCVAILFGWRGTDSFPRPALPDPPPCRGAAGSGLFAERGRRSRAARGPRANLRKTSRSSVLETYRML